MCPRLTSGGEWDEVSNFRARGHEVLNLAGSFSQGANQSEKGSRASATIPALLQQLGGRSIQLWDSKAARSFPLQDRGAAAPASGLGKLQIVCVFCGSTRLEKRGHSRRRNI